MAVDGDTAQIGPELAGAFNIPCVTDVSEIREVASDHIVVTHVTDEGHDVVEVPLPAVITVGKDVAQLRMPSIAGVLAAEDASIEMLSATDAAADPARCGLAGSPTQVVRSFVPERTHDCTYIDGDIDTQVHALANLLREMN